MAADPPEEADLLPLAAAGDEAAARDLFSRYRARLKRMVHLRLSRRLPEFTRDPRLPFVLWVRPLTGL